MSTFTTKEPLPRDPAATSGGLAANEAPRVPHASPTWKQLGQEIRTDAEESATDFVAWFNTHQQGE
jgi:hypothetical protein